jgi:Fe-S cluster assembly protein SufB
MVELSRELYDEVDDAAYKFKTDKGLSEKVVRQISEYKDEPKWMLEKRLRALEIYHELDMPDFGPDISTMN